MIPDEKAERTGQVAVRCQEPSDFTAGCSHLANCGKPRDWLEGVMGI